MLGEGFNFWHGNVQFVLLVSGRNFLLPIIPKLRDYYCINVLTYFIVLPSLRLHSNCTRTKHSTA